MLLNSILEGMSVIGNTTLSMFVNTNKFDYLFEEIGLVNKKNHKPILKDTVSGNSYTAYLFSIPVGLSIDDFKKEKSAISQYLHKSSSDIDIELVNTQALITVKSNVKASFNYEDYKFDTFKDKIPIGVNLLNHKLIYIDIIRDPHILIGGSTNSGKSVAMNIILSYLISHRDDIEIYLQDTKNIDLCDFFNAKQVVCCNEGLDCAEETAKKLEDEMNERYKWLKEHGKGARNMNECKVKNKPKHIFYFIEELASFNPKKDAEFYRSLQELLAKGRAANITVCISTQAPYCDILPGMMKGNLNTKLCFKTTTGEASKVISGDFDLLTELRGRGHGYVIDSNGKTEIQGLNIQYNTIKNIVKHNSK